MLENLKTYSVSQRYCKNGYHCFVWAGDENYFPYEGMPCDCGLITYHKQELENV